MASYTRVYTFNGSTKATLTVTVSTTSTSVTNNTSTEKVKAVFHNPGTSSWGTLTGSLSYNGNSTNINKSYSAGSTVTLLDKSYTTPHNSDGKRTVSFTVNANGNNTGYIEGLYKTDTFTLDTIPRQTKITSYYIDKVDFTSYRVNWVTSDTIDQVQRYSSAEGWVTIWTGSAKSGNWTITGLTPRRVIWSNN